jgi:hypothetical protein
MECRASADKSATSDGRDVELHADRCCRSIHHQSLARSIDDTHTLCAWLVVDVLAAKQTTNASAGRLSKVAVA